MIIIYVLSIRVLTSVWYTERSPRLLNVIATSLKSHCSVCKSQTSVQEVGGVQLHLVFHCMITPQLLDWIVSFLKTFPNDIYMNVCYRLMVLLSMTRPAGLPISPILCLLSSLYLLSYQTNSLPVLCVLPGSFHSLGYSTHEMFLTLSSVRFIFTVCVFLCFWT